jgi:hypothetical protein
MNIRKGLAMAVKAKALTVVSSWALLEIQPLAVMTDGNRIVFYITQIRILCCVY